MFQVEAALAQLQYFVLPCMHLFLLFLLSNRILIPLDYDATTLPATQRSMVIIFDRPAVSYRSTSKQVFFRFLLFFFYYIIICHSFTF